MSLTCTPNHPSTPDSLRVNQYGNINTQSYVQCAGAFNSKAEDFELRLTTNTALENLLDPLMIYYLSGKLIALNDGTMPILTYIQDSVTAVSTTATQPLNFANKCNIHTLGIVVSREEVVSEGSNAATYLNVMITHNDWDAQLQVKTFSFFAVGREVHMVGQLVDFDMENNVAVVLACKPPHAARRPHAYKWREDGQLSVRPRRTGVLAMHACLEGVQALHALQTGVHGWHACPARLT
ncbi:hypothetical protein PCANC_05875 [Puccinia coronata f. sp. avenae]|uniref:Uncharacterized protein n=1 Tax=Puccinia coronata f. sp. avenae TaxID=200324 RepID=A0A2N5VBW6_9BASI|nr:hypothetical protein PCANC_05875 [Puccinia coronata f. sp. avenae]